MKTDDFLSYPQRPRHAENPTTIRQFLQKPAVLLLPWLLFEYWMYNLTDAFRFRPLHACLLLQWLILAPAASLFMRKHPKLSKTAVWMLQTAVIVVLSVCFYLKKLYSVLRKEVLLTLNLPLVLLAAAAFLIFTVLAAGQKRKA